LPLLKFQPSYVGSLNDLKQNDNSVDIRCQVLLLLLLLLLLLFMCT